MINRLARRLPRADLKTTAASVVGLAPGLVLPFVVALRLGSAEADGLLFALSLSTVAINVVTTSLEANSVARIGPTRGSIPVRTMLGVFRSSVVASVAAVSVFVPLLFALFYVRDHRWGDYLALAVAFGATPLIAVLGSPFAGGLIARGRSEAPIVTQGIRSLAALAVLVAFPHASALLVGIVYAAGEVVRSTALAALWHRLNSRATAAPLPPTDSTAGLATQFGAAAVAQGNAMVNRVLLSGAPVGSITAYELAEKATFALYQFIYSSLVVRRFGVWSSIVDPEARASRYRADVKRTTLLTLALSIMTVAGSALGLYFRIIPDEWRLGATWALVMVPSAAASIAMISAIRMLVIANRQRHLVYVSSGSLVLNVILAVSFFGLFGAVGIPLALVVNRAATAVAYYRLTRNLGAAIPAGSPGVVPGTSEQLAAS